MYDIEDKVALITGACSGIGLSTVKELLRNGLKGVTLVDRNDESGHKILKEINEEFSGKKAIFKKADVSNKDQLEDAFEATIHQFKNLDIVVNSAGLCNDKLWQEQLLANVNGTINSSLMAFEHYLPKYRSENEGVIINLASEAALDTFEIMPIYAASKSAVIKFSTSLGAELHYKRTNVRIVTLCPGATNTPILTADDPSNRMLGPAFEELALKCMTENKVQECSCVSKAIVKIIKESESGSIWVVENDDPPYQVRFPRKEELYKK